MHGSKICFTFVKPNKNGIFAPILTLMETKDRIRLIMEDQHMTQQVFADFLQQSPATLSSIFNGRTRPTLNIVDSIKAKIPDISIEWLLYGTGEMYSSHSHEAAEDAKMSPGTGQNLMLDFASDGHPVAEMHQNKAPGASFYAENGQHTGANLNINGSRAEYPHEEVRIVEREPRRVTEIRVYYDDQTYETFVPAKNK